MRLESYDTICRIFCSRGTDIFEGKKEETNPSESLVST